jgi:hypothetical protein
MLASTIAEVAMLLDGQEDRRAADKDVDTLLKSLGFVVVFGLSDDLIEIRGVSDVEIDGWQGQFRVGDRQDLRFTPEGLVDDHTALFDEEKGDFVDMPEAPPPPGAAIVDVRFGKDDLFWVFETEAPHATFVTTLHGNPFCRGIVLDLANLS